MNALLTAGATFGVFAAINVCWTLIIGTASIFSLATYAVVGTAAFVTSLLSIRLGVPWYALPPIGAGIGLCVRRPHRGAGASARRLLLRLAHPRPQRTLPRLLHHLEAVRCRLGRALWRRFLHQSESGRR